MKKIDLKELVGGALQEQFAKSFESIVENLQNPNTPFKAPREITIKLKFSQNENRDNVRCAIAVSEKLAPQTPMETAFAIGKDLKTGKVYAEEWGNQLKMGFEDSSDEEEIGVDTETGEIIERSPKILDFKKVMQG